MKVPYDPCLARSIHPVWFPRFSKKWRIRHEIFGFFDANFLIRHKYLYSSFPMNLLIKICKFIREIDKKKPLLQGGEENVLISAYLYALSRSFWQKGADIGKLWPTFA